MTAGITFAQAHQLRPGIALSAGQIALLTTDIVWLQSEMVTLPDGSTSQALGPMYTPPCARVTWPSLAPCSVATM